MLDFKVEEVVILADGPVDTWLHTTGPLARLEGFQPRERRGRLSQV